MLVRVIINFLLFLCNKHRFIIFIKIHLRHTSLEYAGFRLGFRRALTFNFYRIFYEFLGKMPGFFLQVPVHLLLLEVIYHVF